MEYWRFIGHDQCQHSGHLHSNSNGCERMYSNIEYYDHVRSICTDSYDKQFCYGFDMYDYEH